MKYEATPAQAAARRQDFFSRRAQEVRSQDPRHASHLEKMASRASEELEQQQG